MIQDIYSALLMSSFGINTVVMTRHSKIDWYLNEYLTQPDSLFGGGLGKKELLRRLEYLLPKEDQYFDFHPDQAITTNQRWVNFCEDCIVLATLAAFLEEKNILLIHPDSYKSNTGINSQYEKIENQPTLIPGIPSLH
jgi:hypothetical protein